MKTDVTAKKITSRNPKAKLAFEEYLSNKKLSKIQRDELLYAKSKWEFLRRNHEFRKYLIDDNKKRKTSGLNALVSMKKWQLEDRWLSWLRGKKSFEELIDTPFEKLVYDYAAYSQTYSGKISKKAYKLSILAFVQCLLPDELNPIWCEFGEIQACDHNGELVEVLSNHLTISIDMRFKISKVKEAFERFIDMCHPDFPTESKLPKKVRDRHSYKLYPNYLRVYDLRKEEQGMTFLHIAKQILPEYFDVVHEEDNPEHNPDSAEKAVIDYYKKPAELSTMLTNFDHLGVRID